MRMHIILVKNLEDEQMQKSIINILENNGVQASVSLSSKSVCVEGNGDDLARIKRILVSIGCEIL